ncbi:GNAT family N-acetyltransferase [Dysgonomonadaceae bacterium zrk40]|nr:GNAT family N-acetyltransferase [Dysgonomonadaceae bacterium zrk40]
MIRYADKHSREAVRAMWKSCFGDPDDYMDVYFRHKYRDDQTLIYFDREKAVASLQMLPYNFTFHGIEIPVLYLSGVCTLPEARRKGVMHQLLLRSFEVAREREFPMMLLVPQEEWLLGFYAKYGFAQTFDAGRDPLPSLKSFLDAHSGDLQAAYRSFDSQFRGCEMTLQKTYDDFCAMVEEASLYHFPPKKNLTGMSRIIDLERLLQIYAAAQNGVNFSLKVDDPLLKRNSGAYAISGGMVIKDEQPLDSMLQLSITDLTQHLMGYHTSEEAGPVTTLFPEKAPAMHYMLE